MASGFGPEGPGSIPDAAKDPPSACGHELENYVVLKVPWLIASSLVTSRCCPWRKFPSLSET